MKDSMKITVKYQFVYMLLMQVAASGVAFVFGLVAFWYFLSINIAKEIISVIHRCKFCNAVYTCEKLCNKR